MATFGLVHGAGHGAWCWERLTPILEARGHRVFAMDLPCEDQTAGAERYAEVVDRAIPPANDLVLVGHSLAGLTIPLVAARRPLARLVFLCALVPEFGRNLYQQVQADPELYHPVARTHPGRLTAPDGTVTFRDADAMRDVFYQDCSPEDARWAFARLRPQSAAPRREACPLTGWPPGERAYILCREDRAISPAWSRRVAKERLGVEPIELGGSHSPFVSQPATLADVLDRLARDRRAVA
jgi:alpha/beta hydrolase family protein